MTREKRMKSDEVRKNWAEALRHVRNGGTVIITHYTDEIAAIVPRDRIKETTMTYTLTIVRGSQPNAVGEEFGLAGINVDHEVHAWFAAHGADEPGDHEIWVLVTPADENVGDLVNVIAQRDVTVPA